MSPLNMQDLGVVQAQALAKQVAALKLPNNLADFCAQQAKALGNQVALNFFEYDVTVSYNQLHQRSNCAADSLQKMGVKKGDHVALMMHNHPDYLVSWFAIAKLGAVIIPVNFAYTPSELQYVLSDSHAQFLMIGQAYLNTFSAMEVRPAPLINEHLVVFSDEQENKQHLTTFEQLVKDGEPDFSCEYDVALNDLMQIQYTSGTTGFPKGCMQTHEYWLFAANSAAAIISGQDIKNVLSMFPMFYMEPQIQLLVTLVVGGTAFVATKPSASKFMGWVREHNIHYCTFHEVVMKGIPQSAADAHNPLKYVSAFQYKGDAHRQLESRFNLIGRDAFAMTETGSGTFMPTNATHMVGLGSCGLPAPMRHFKLVNDVGMEVAQGESGVLWVKGRGLFLGYYNKPEANAAEFDGEWFCSGDIARQDENGYFYIVGRTKEMIKRSGENIAAREVEAVLRELPQVMEAAVLPVPDEQRREEVKAYVILRDGLTKDDCPVQTLLDHCTRHLATFKLPRYIAYVQGFPRTPSNKVAKQKMIDDCDDLRLGAYDRVDNIWR